MEENKNSKSPFVPKTAIAALYLGIGSISAFLLSILVGWLVESIGISDLFRSIVIPLSLASIVCGIIARRKISAEGHKGHRTATTGMIMGIISLSMVIVFMVVVFIFFIPMLFA